MCKFLPVSLSTLSISGGGGGGGGDLNRDKAPGAGGRSSDKYIHHQYNPRSFRSKLEGNNKGVGWRLSCNVGILEEELIQTSAMSKR